MVLFQRAISRNMISFVIFNVLFHFLVKSLIEQIDLGLICAAYQINTTIFRNSPHLTGIVVVLSVASKFHLWRSKRKWVKKVVKKFGLRFLRSKFVVMKMGLNLWLARVRDLVGEVVEYHFQVTLLIYLRCLSLNLILLHR